MKLGKHKNITPEDLKDVPIWKLKREYRIPRHMKMSRSNLITKIVKAHSDGLDDMPFPDLLKVYGTRPKKGMKREDIVKIIRERGEDGGADSTNSRFFSYGRT